MFFQNEKLDNYNNISSYSESNANSKLDYLNNDIELLKAENFKLKNYNEKIMKQLQQEIISNDQQKIKIKQLKQIIESSNGKNKVIKNNLDYIRKTFFNNIDYSEMIIQIGKNIEDNKYLNEENIEMKKELNILNNQIQRLREVKNIYDNFQNDFQSLNSEKKILENNYSEITSDYQKKLNELQCLNYRNNELEKQNLILNNEIEKMNIIKKENEELTKKLSDLKDKNNNLIYDNSYLKDYQSEYDKLTRENIHLKEQFEELKKENKFYENQYNQIKEYLDKHNNRENLNEQLNNEIKALNKKIEFISSEKDRNENYYKEKIKMIEKEKDLLEKMLIKKQNFENENTSNSSNNYSLVQDKYYLLNNNSNNLFTSKYIEENQFFSSVLSRLIKYHINNIQVKNIICEILNSNEKKILLTEQIEKKEKEIEQFSKYGISDEQKNKMRNDSLSNKKQLNEIIQKIDLLQNMLKQYEK
jgi:hypothetical protein